MYVSTTQVSVPEAMTVAVTDDTLTAELSDGRTVSVPLAWYPRLVHATPHERAKWEMIGRGQGVHWPDLDEDISIESLLAGRKSGESHRSFQQWLDAKGEGRGLTLNELTAHEEARQHLSDYKYWIGASHPARAVVHLPTCNHCRNGYGRGSKQSKWYPVSDFESLLPTAEETKRSSIVVCKFCALRSPELREFRSAISRRPSVW